MSDDSSYDKLEKTIKDFNDYLAKLKKEIERLEEENCIMRDTLNRYGIEPSNGKEW